MADITITNTDVEALAGKLESMRDQFSDSEYAALHAVFNLAGAGIADADAGDVEGFAYEGYLKATNFELSFGMIPTGPLSLNASPIIGGVRGGSALKHKLGGTAHKD